MKTASSTANLALRLVLIGFVLAPLGLLQAGSAAGSKGNQRKPQNIVAPRSRGASSSYSKKSEDEKQYEGLSLELRKRDVAFQEEWSKASPDQRSKLREARLQEHPATLVRMKDLASKIMNDRKATRQATLPEAVKAPAKPRPDDSFKDKGEVELKKLGVDIDALHKKEGGKE